MIDVWGSVGTVRTKLSELRLHAPRNGFVGSAIYPGLETLCNSTLNPHRGIGNAHRHALNRHVYTAHAGWIMHVRSHYAHRSFWFHIPVICSDLPGLRSCNKRRFVYNLEVTSFRAAVHLPHGAPNCA